MDRRNFIQFGGMAVAPALATRVSRAEAQEIVAAVPTTAGGPSARQPIVAPGGQVGVVTPNGSTLPWRIAGGVKVGRLVAEAVDNEFAPGLRAECWGYNRDGGHVDRSPAQTAYATCGSRFRLDDPRMADRRWRPPPGAESYAAARFLELLLSTESLC